MPTIYTPFVAAFCPMMAESSSCDKDVEPLRLNILTIWPFTKNLLVPGLGQMEETCSH